MVVAENVLNHKIFRAHSDFQKLEDASQERKGEIDLHGTNFTSSLLASKTGITAKDCGRVQVDLRPPESRKEHAFTLSNV